MKKEKKAKAAVVSPDAAKESTVFNAVIQDLRGEFLADEALAGVATELADILASGGKPEAILKLLAKSEDGRSS